MQITKENIHFQGSYIMYKISFDHAFLFDKIRRKADRAVYMFTNDFRMFHLAALLQHLEK